MAFDRGADIEVEFEPINKGRCSSSSSDLRLLLAGLFFDPLLDFICFIFSHSTRNRFQMARLEEGRMNKKRKMSAE